MYFFQSRDGKNVDYSHLICSFFSLIMYLIVTLSFSLKKFDSYGDGWDGASLAFLPCDSDISLGTAGSSFTNGADHVSHCNFNQCPYFPIFHSNASLNSYPLLDRNFVFT